MNVPIIGQPQVTDWAITLQVTCTCKQTFMLIGQVGAIRQCKCGKLYCLMGVPTSAGDPTNPNLLNVPLGMRNAPDGQEG